MGLWVIGETSNCMCVQAEMLARVPGCEKNIVLLKSDSTPEERRDENLRGLLNYRGTKYDK